MGRSDICFQHLGRKRIRVERRIRQLGDKRNGGIGFYLMEQVRSGFAKTKDSCIPGIVSFLILMNLIFFYIQ